MSPEGERIQGWNVMVPISVHLSLYIRLPVKYKEVIVKINYDTNLLLVNQYSGHWFL